MAQEIYERQFSIGDILSLSWNKFTENFKLIMFITLIVYIPINIVLSFIPIDESGEGLMLYIRTIQILELLVGIIATMAIAYLIKNKIDGKETTLGLAFKKSLSRWGAGVGTSLVAGFLLILLFLLLLVPGIIFSVYWTFFIMAVILSNKSGKAALDYSKAIVKERWWLVFGYGLVFGIMAIVASLVISAPALFLPENLISSVVFDTLVDVVYSFFTVISVIFFLNFDATKVKPNESK